MDGRGSDGRLLCFRISLKLDLVRCGRVGIQSSSSAAEEKYAQARADAFRWAYFLD